MNGVSAPPWISVSERRKLSPDPTYTVDANSPQMLRLAAAQALELGHDSVGAAHLLLGILANEDDPASQVLHRHGVALAPQREAVASLLADAQHAPSSDNATCLTARAISAMARASMEARQRETLEIAPMHLLLALIASPDAAEVLGLAGVDLAALRVDVRAELGDY